MGFLGNMFHHLKSSSNYLQFCDGTTMTDESMHYDIVCINM